MRDFDEMLRTDAAPPLGVAVATDSVGGQIGEGNRGGNPQEESTPLLGVGVTAGGGP